MIYKVLSGTLSLYSLTVSLIQLTFLKTTMHFMTVLFTYEIACESCHHAVVLQAFQPLNSIWSGSLVNWTMNSHCRIAMYIVELV